MIKNPSYSAKTRIAENPNPGTRTTANPHRPATVNQPQGPRTGNNPATAKRTAFVDGKQDRAPLADVITNAFAGRTPRDHVNPALEGVHTDTNVKFKRR